MRTAIFLGLTYIGDAIGTPLYMSKEYVAVLTIAFLVFVTMDIVDFFKNK